MHESWTGGDAKLEIANNIDWMHREIMNDKLGHSRTFFNQKRIYNDVKKSQRKIRHTFWNTFPLLLSATKWEKKNHFHPFVPKQIEEEEEEMNADNSENSAEYYIEMWMHHWIELIA